MLLLMDTYRQELVFNIIVDGCEKSHITVGNPVKELVLVSFMFRLKNRKEGRKERFYLTTHSTHFIYGYMEGKEEKILFNDALNTFQLRLYGVRHI